MLLAGVSVKLKVPLVGEVVTTAVQLLNIGKIGACASRLVAQGSNTHTKGNRLKAYSD